MAKTKAGPGRQINRIRLNNNNNNNNNNKKHMQNGLYVHSSPPKALNDDTGPATAKIREYIRAADVEALENVVLLGQGTKLINQHATDQRVRNFLKTVPSYMSKIDLVHDSVEKGNLRDLKALLDRRKLARSKDAQGVGLLHKAVVHGHRDIVDYLVTDYPETLEVTDNKSLTVEALGRLLETVPELPEDQTPEPLTPSCTPSPTPDPEPSHAPKTRVATRQEAWVEGDATTHEVVSLEAGSGLELELADWSAGDATGCYPSLASPSGQQLQEEDSLVFSPALARSITYLLSRGRSGRLPRLPPPPDSPLGAPHTPPTANHSPHGDEHPPLGAAQLSPILRLTNHAQCVDSDAQLPPTTNRGRQAYLKHVQRLAGCRPLGPEGAPLGSPRALLTPHTRLPAIPRRPRRESPHPVLPRPLTPTPTPIAHPNSCTLPRTRWRRAASDAAIAERLNASLRNIRDSDSDEGEGGNDPATPATPRPHSSTDNHNPRPITVPPPSGTPSPTPTDGETPTPVLMPTLISLERDPGVTRPEATHTQHRQPATADPHSPLQGQPTNSPTSIRADETLRGNLSSSSHVEPEVTHDSHQGPSSELEVELDLQVRSYSEASSTMQKYVRWLSSRVMGHGFADLKGIYFRRIARHQERLKVWEVVYEHDVTYWARVIVERVLESVIDFLLELEKEGQEGAKGEEPLVGQRNVSESGRGKPKRGRSSARSKNRSRASKGTPGDCDAGGEPESQSAADMRLQSTAASLHESEAFELPSSEVESHTDFPAEECSIPHNMGSRGQSSTKPGRRDFPLDGTPIDPKRQEAEVRTQESELRTAMNPKRRSANTSGRRPGTRRVVSGGLTYDTDISIRDYTPRSLMQFRKESSQTPSEPAVDWQTHGQLITTLQASSGRRSTAATPSDGQVSSGNDPRSLLTPRPSSSDLHVHQLETWPHLSPSATHHPAPPARPSIQRSRSQVLEDVQVLFVAPGVASVDAGGPLSSGTHQRPPPQPSTRSSTIRTREDVRDPSATPAESSFKIRQSSSSSSRQASARPSIRTRVLENVKTLVTPPPPAASPVQGDQPPSLPAQKPPSAQHLTSTQQPPSAQHLTSAQGHSAAPEHDTQGVPPQQSPHFTTEYGERTESNITETLGAWYAEDTVSQANPTTVPQSNPTTVPRANPTTVSQANPSQSNLTTIPQADPTTVPQANPRPGSALLKRRVDDPVLSESCSMADSGHGSLHNSTSGPHSGTNAHNTPTDVNQTSDPPMALSDPRPLAYTQPKDSVVGDDPARQPPHQPRCASSQTKNPNRMDDALSCSGRSAWDFVEESPSLTSYELHRLFRSPALGVGRTRRWTPRTPSPTMGELRTLVQREDGLATVDETTSMLATEGPGDGGACGGRPADDTSLRTDAGL